MSKERKFHVVLTEAERDTLKTLSKKTTSTNARTRCIVLLNADEPNFFMDNMDDVRFLESRAGMEAIAMLHTEGITDYLQR